jgi:hypothetical protein
MKRAVLTVSAMLSCLVLGSCSRGGTPREVTITSRDFSFDAPDSIPAGLVTIHLHNLGPDLHHVWLVRLDEGKTMDDFAAAIQKGAPPAWAVHVGGPNAAIPNGDNRATMVLQPGLYALLCMIPDTAGVPHAMKGMMRTIRVTGSASSAALPASDNELTLKDYDFVFAKALHKGTQVIRVKNEADQVHEIVVVRLLEGKKAEDFVAWAFKRQGPPPAELVGGMSGISKGQESQMSLDLTPGNYAMVCFLPDAKDGKMHFEHGMVKEVRID